MVRTHHVANPWAAMSILYVAVSLVALGAVRPSAARGSEENLRTVGRAVGRIDPSRATVFTVSPNGIAVTAYHAISACVVDLRKDPRTAPLFRPDGSYSGEPLGCPGFSARFPSEHCDSLGAPRTVSLLAIPSEVNRQSGATSPESPPASDFALIAVDPPPQSFLKLSPNSPEVGAAVQVIGYAGQPVQAQSGSPDGLLKGLSIVALTWEVRLQELLIDAAGDPHQASKAARVVLQEYQRSLPREPIMQEALAVFMKDTLERLEAISSGGEQAVGEIRRALEEMAAAREQQADQVHTEPKVAELLRSEAVGLRELAVTSSGPAVAAVLTRRRDVSQATLDQLDEEMRGVARRDGIRPACVNVATAGVVTGVNGHHLRVDAWAGPGMSGGPVLDLDGAVVGIVSLLRYPEHEAGERVVICSRGDLVQREYDRIVAREARVAAPK